MVKHVTDFIFYYLAIAGAVQQVIWSWLLSHWFPIELLQMLSILVKVFEEIQKVESFAGNSAGKVRNQPFI